ncbi:ABC transporter permease subunit [Paenalkalicoccus suaedae]|uniref:ABC transporter permease subunit n=1 Tax=Paenalkalicoccus suaedae TaxID=2592382 RepID=A0A859FEP8_9BACI|nr:ABC transporter permease subunit [Paenalkalicoccus suaedae]QKS70706.1 ABC transporter permease subunit [Paenalkalicoccus suaedae]
MFEKALWYQNFKQSRMMIWILFTIFVLQMPVQTIFTLQAWRERSIEAENTFGYTFEIGSFEVSSIFFYPGLYNVIIALIITVLAALMIGLERNTRRNDFTFALPYSRKSLFLAKWALGMTAILGSFIVNFIIAYLLIYFSSFSYALDLVSLTEIFVAPLIAFAMFYSFALFIGTISGEMISQIVLTFIFGFFPLGFSTLVYDFFLTNNIATILPSINYWNWIEYITPLYSVVGANLSLIGFLINGILTVLFTVGGIYLYQENKIEHNGEFLIFKRLTIVFLIGITLCFSLLGGLFISAFAPWGSTFLRIIAYWIGFLTFLLFSLILSRKILSMNLLFRGKAS